MIELIDLVEYDIANFKLPSMFVVWPHCSFKCGPTNCQNYGLREEPKVKIEAEEIVKRYLENPLTEAIVMGGLEPFDSFDELLKLCRCFRAQTPDPIVIYTGYEEKEILELVKKVTPLGNIIIKFGRYIANGEECYDEILGMTLSSSNQYAVEYF